MNRNCWTDELGAFLYIFLISEFYNEHRRDGMCWYILINTAFGA